MGSFEVVALLVTLAAVFAYLNHRFLHLHPTIGIMLQAFLASLAWVGFEHIWPTTHRLAEGFRDHVDVNEAVFHWMLGPLLFAASLRVDLSELKNQRRAVAALSVLGTLISTFVIAGICYGLLAAVGMHTPFIACAIFGIIISPTDPVAVMGFLKRLNAPSDIEVIVGGESLFNDGIGVVLFSVLVGLNQSNDFHFSDVVWTFVRQTAGGAGIGLVLGLVVFQMLKSVYAYAVEVLLTVALALGGYALADALGVSGPIAAVVAGIIIGNHGRNFAMSDITREHLDHFWEMIDETLNAVLFLLVGLVVLEMHLQTKLIVGPMVAIPVVLFARWLSVWISAMVVKSPLPRRRELRKNSIAILTWGGLRGGLAVAMALSLPLGEHRDLILASTYAVVVFSILVQGASLPWLFERWVAGDGKMLNL